MGNEFEAAGELETRELSLGEEILCLVGREDALGQPVTKIDQEGNVQYFYNENGEKILTNDFPQVCIDAMEQLVMTRNALKAFKDVDDVKFKQIQRITLPRINKYLPSKDEPIK